MLIKLTTHNEITIYINPEQIGHCYRVDEKIENRYRKESAHTILGVTTHNNGGFKIKETPEQIIKLIEKL
jgi:hypothetical protein